MLKNAMAISYVVLYGKRGVKDGFRKLERAKAWAQTKADKLGKKVYIDRVTTYPNAKRGMVDWSQRHQCYINPKKRKVVSEHKTLTKAKKTPKRKTPEKNHKYGFY